MTGMSFCSCAGEKCDTEFTLDGELRIYGDIYVPTRVTRAPRSEKQDDGQRDLRDDVSALRIRRVALFLLVWLVSTRA